MSSKSNRDALVYDDVCRLSSRVDVAVAVDDQGSVKAHGHEGCSVRVDDDAHDSRPRPTPAARLPQDGTVHVDDYAGQVLGADVVGATDESGSGRSGFFKGRQGTGTETSGTSGRPSGAAAVNRD